MITAGAAIAVNFGVENISGFKFWATLTLLDQGRAVASFFVYVLINTVLVAGSVMITVYYAPAAAGSGIAEVKVSEQCLYADYLPARSGNQVEGVIGLLAVVLYQAVRRWLSIM